MDSGIMLQPARKAAQASIAAMRASGAGRVAAIPLPDLKSLVCMTFNRFAPDCAYRHATRVRALMAISSPATVAIRKRANANIERLTIYKRHSNNRKRGDQPTTPHTGRRHYAIMLI